MKRVKLCNGISHGKKREARVSVMVSKGVSQAAERLRQTGSVLCETCRAKNAIKLIAVGSFVSF